MPKSEAFLDYFGDGWLEREREGLGKNDLPTRLIEKHSHLQIPKVRFLEIGCSNGWRLKKYQEKYNWETWGIEPSEKARNEDSSISSAIVSGTIEDFSVDGEFDIVLVGWCMSLVDPEDWPIAVSNVNRVLKKNGVLLVHDYYSPTHMSFPIEGHDWTMNIAPFNEFWSSFPTYKEIDSVLEAEANRSHWWAFQSVCYMLQKADLNPQMESADSKQYLD